MPEAQSHTLTNLPVLYKRTSGGGVQTWLIWVTSTPEQYGSIHTAYGLQGGKLQNQTEIIKEGKNAGRKNATTAIQQAIAEATARWEKQKTRKAYGLTVEESADVRGEAAMLAQDYAKHLSAIEWDAAYGQPKLDGFRCLAKCRDGKVSLFSREHKPIESMPHIVEQLASVLKDGDTLDGELFVPGVAFQKIASLIKRQQEGSERIQYHVYDAMLDAPFIDRYQQAQAKIRRLSRDVVVPVNTRLITDLDQLMSFQADCVAQGFEGAMLRHGRLAYDAGKRSKYLLKVKTFQDAEFLITDAREGRGTHVGMAIFLCKTPAGHEFEVMAHGTHDEKRAAWANKQQHIGKKLTVKFQEWSTSEEPVPRFPVALRFAE